MHINGVSLSNVARTDKTNFSSLKIMPSARRVLTEQVSSRLMSASHLRSTRIATQQLEKSYVLSFLDTLENYFSKFKECKMTLAGTKKGELKFSFSPNTKTMGKKSKINLKYNEDPRLNQCTLENIQDVAAEYHQIIKEGTKNGEYDNFHFFRFFKLAGENAKPTPKFPWNGDNRLPIS